MEKPTVRSQPITLFFDVNRTILIEDLAAGKKKEDELCSIFSSEALGRVLVDPPPPRWEALSDVKLGERPPIDDKGICSYYSFVQDILHPLPTFGSDVPKDEASEKVEKVKNQRRSLMKRFVEPNEPGERFRPEFERLMKKLDLPPGFDLLPSFFHFILDLEKKGRPFSLCFRTFGQDVERVVAEWNAFCDGKHPLFPNVNPTFQKKKIAKDNIGSFFRYGRDKDSSVLAMGTLLQPPLSQVIPGQELDFYQDKPDVRLIKGFSAIDDFLQSKFQSGHSLALRDYYPWWAANSEHHDSGKLFFIDPRGTHPHRQRAIFFDDNLRVSDFHSTKHFIADVRDIETGESVTNLDSLFPSYLVRADALRAIDNERYFIDELERSDASWESL